MRIVGRLLTNQRGLFSNQRGATAIEYALIASLISVAAIVGFENLGDKVDNRFSAIDQTLDGTI